MIRMTLGAFFAGLALFTFYWMGVVEGHSIQQDVQISGHGSRFYNQLATAPPTLLTCLLLLFILAAVSFFASAYLKRGDSAKG